MPHSYQEGSLPKSTPSAPESKQKFPATLLRIYWMFLGYMPILFAIRSIIYNKETAFFTTGDIIFLITFLMIIVVRFIDVRFFGGETGDGEPATMKHFYKYVVQIFAIFIVVWGCFHLLNHVFFK